MEFRAEKRSKRCRCLRTSWRPRSLSKLQRSATRRDARCLCVETVDRFSDDVVVPLQHRIEAIVQLCRSNTLQHIRHWSDSDHRRTQDFTVEWVHITSRGGVRCTEIAPRRHPSPGDNSPQRNLTRREPSSVKCVPSRFPCYLAHFQAPLSHLQCLVCT